MNSILHEVWINPERSTVFAAITTRDGLDSWWGRQCRPSPSGWGATLAGLQQYCETGEQQ